MNTPSTKKTPSSPLKVTPPSQKLPRERKRHPSASTRHRLSEADEDEELLEDELEITGTTITRFTDNPWYIKNGTMRDYQIRGLNWMISLFENGINGILADEMGLGKTLQTIALLGYMCLMRDVPGPHVVIAPKSTLSNWMAEFKRWSPGIITICLIGNQAERVCGPLVMSDRYVYTCVFGLMLSESCTLVLEFHSTKSTYCVSLADGQQRLIIICFYCIPPVCT